MRPDDLLAAAAREPEHSPRRALLLTAAVEQILGRPAVLVGGAAANTYTGEYLPTDLDLVVEGMVPEDRARLVEHGFQDPGRGHRHLSIRLADDEEPVLVEFPPLPLQAETTDEVVIAPGVSARVISLEDLVMDRLRQATDGTAVTREAAVALVVAAYEEMDWDRIHRRVSQERADLPSLPGALAEVQRGTKRALRAARLGRGGRGIEHRREG